MELELYDLLQKILEVDGDYRIRISSIEPNLLNDNIIDLTAENSKMCNHFHIPLQSGSENILKKMQRRYKASYYKDLIHRVVNKVDDVGIGVDVITGFPGEGEEDFLETYNFIKELPVTYLHVFTYSERPNTKAIDMPNTVDMAERKKRTNMLRILSEKKKSEFYRKRIGRELNVLFEQEDHDGMMRGFASNYIRVAAPYNSQYINRFTKVVVKEFRDGICSSEIINSNENYKSLAG